MPVNNEMEILIQQKMEGFRVEPAPADWQAIYEKLHPKKERRFFWWWLPLAAGLLFGGYWITEQNQSSGPHVKAVDLPAAKSPARSIPGIVKNEVPLIKDPSSTTSIATNPAMEKSALSIVSSIQSPTVDQQLNHPADAKPSDNNEAALRENKIEIDPVTHPFASEKKQTHEEIRDRSASPEVHHKDTLSTPEPSMEYSVKMNSIPNLSTHANKGWNLGAYAEIGSNKPTEPVSMAKSADLNSFPASGSSSTTTSTGSTSKGLHYALGISLERKLKKISFSFGLGIQSNTWSSTSATYKDSIVGGNFFTRTQVSTNNSNYTHTAMELPVMLNVRIAGKKHSSYWFTTGLNNAITLKLDQKTDLSILQSSASSSLDNSITSKASPYQPQLRIGLTYENTQDRYYWELSPFVQYGLNSMVKTGSPDTHLLHFGIQTRYYFKKLK